MIGEGEFSKRETASYTPDFCLCSQMQTFHLMQKSKKASFDHETFSIIGSLQKQY